MIGEDDVVIIADLFDTSENNINDGDTIWIFERAYYQMEIEVFKIKDNNFEFINVKRKS